MERFRNILFFHHPAVDQGAAIGRAAALAKRNGAALTLFAVIRELPRQLRMSASEASGEAIQSELMRARQAELEELAGTLRREGIAVEVAVAAGSAFVEVIRRVLRARHDLLVLAAEGRRTLLHRLFGSTSIHLLRKCPCPVWVVKPGADASFHRVLAAVDTTDYPWDELKRTINPSILELAVAVARADGSALHIVQAWSAGDEGYLQVRGQVSDAAIRKLRQNAKRDYIERLDYLLGGIDLTGVSSVHRHVLRGDKPAEVIVRLVRKEKIDLLVMGTVCRVGLAGFFIGNTAEEVLGAVDCSVLALKPEGFVSPVTL